MKIIRLTRRLFTVILLSMTVGVLAFYGRSFLKNDVLRLETALRSLTLQSRSSHFIIYWHKLGDPTVASIHVTFESFPLFNGDDVKRIPNHLDAMWEGRPGTRSNFLGISTWHLSYTEGTIAEFVAIPFPWIISVLGLIDVYLLLKHRQRKSKSAGFPIVPSPTDQPPIGETA